MGSSEAKREAEFATAVEGGLERLRRVIRQALDLVEIEKPGPTAIGKRLGLDKSLAWKLGRIATASEELRALEYLPGRKGTRLIVQSFGAAGVGENVCNELAEAFDSLDREIVLHAGDRSTAQAMARAALPTQRQRLDETLRRDHFRTAGEIWGAQARVQVKADFFAPGRRRGQIDIAGFEGFVDLLRLRPDVSWCVGSKRVVKSKNLRHVVFKPLQPQPTGESNSNGPPLFSDYCSGPVSDLVSVKGSEGYVNYELSPDRVGRTGAVTCLIATHCKNVIELDPPPQDNNLVAVVDLRTPVELMVFDIFVHRSIVAKGGVRTELLGQLKKGASFPRFGSSQVLPIPIRAERLSVANGEYSLAEVPRHAAAIDDTLRLAGEAFGAGRWEPADFVGWRIKLSYPPAPSIAVLRLPLKAPD